MPALSPTSAVPSLAAAERRREGRSVRIGVACTVLFHLFLVLLAPLLPTERLTGGGAMFPATAGADRAKDFNIELAPLPEPEQAARDPFRFVETNPDAPENAPDRTANFSNRNQQSGQLEKPTEIDPENRPSVKGRDDVQGGAIVSGNRAPPSPGAPAVPLQQALEEMVPQDAREAQQARAEQVPLPGFEKLSGDSPDGVGTNVSTQKAASTGADEYVEGVRESPNREGGAVEQRQTPRMVPRERPRLASASTARSSPLQNRLAGTPNLRALGIDARWNEFGQYMAELIESVDAEFQTITSGYRGHIASGTRVMVTFTLNADGEVKVTQIEETAGRVAVSQAQAAITNRMPYKKWSQAMVDVLGDQQTITFGFYYY